MPMETTYTAARANLAKLCDRVVDDRDAVIIRRRSGRDVALIAADEWSSLMETVHLFSSPTNRERLLRAYRRAKQGGGKRMTVEQLRREVGCGRQD